MQRTDLLGDRAYVFAGESNATAGRLVAVGELRAVPAVAQGPLNFCAITSLNTQDPTLFGTPSSPAIRFANRARCGQS